MAVSVLARFTQAATSKNRADKVGSQSTELLQRRGQTLTRESLLKNLLTSGSSLRRFWIAVSIAWIAFIPLDVAGGVPFLHSNDANGGELRPATKSSRNTTLEPAFDLGMLQPAGRFGCVFCRLIRESAADFTAVEHPNGGPSRILLMRHADKPKTVR